MTDLAIDTSAAPIELWEEVREFFPADEWHNAIRIAKLESDWNAFALNDTVDAEHPCGAVIGIRDGVKITAERSVGFFQINACNFPDWNPWHFYNTRHNVGTAHMLWDEAGESWRPWFFSARRLGLI